MLRDDNLGRGEKNERFIIKFRKQQWENSDGDLEGVQLLCHTGTDFRTEAMVICCSKNRKESCGILKINRINY